MRRAFDGDLATAYAAASAPVDGSFLARELPAPVTAGSVAVVGTGVGEIQVARDGAWVTVGALREGARFHEAELGGAPVTGVRLLFAAARPHPPLRPLLPPALALRPRRPARPSALTSPAPTDRSNREEDHE